MQDTNFTKSCLKTITDAVYKPELVMRLITLYTNKGKELFYEREMKNHNDEILRKTIERDVLFSAKLLDLQVSESRMTSIIRKDSEPKKKDERIVANLKSVFTNMHKNGARIELTSNEFLQLGTAILKGVKKQTFIDKQIKTTYNILEDVKVYSFRTYLEEELEFYKMAIDDKKYEVTQLVSRLYVDIIKQGVFTEINDFMALAIVYCLLLRANFTVFRYASLMEIYYNKMSEFKTAVAKAEYNWELGFANPEELNILLIDAVNYAYFEAEKIVFDDKYNKKINISKVNTLASMIMHLPTTFSKKDIKEYNPTISDSTINRALVQLRDEGKIAPNGTGRSATWRKLVDDETLAKDAQISMFELLDD